MAGRGARCGGSPRRKSHTDAVPSEREVFLGRGRCDVAVPRGDAERPARRTDLSLLQTSVVPAADVLRGVFPADGHVDPDSGHRDDRNVLRLLLGHGRPPDSGTDPRGRREPRWGVAQDGDDALLRRDDEGRDPDRDAREGRVEAVGGTAREHPRHPLLPSAPGGRRMTFLERTTDTRRLRHWEGNLEADYIYTSGLAGERFFVALRDDGRLLAARCTACGLDYLPP